MTLTEIEQAIAEQRNNPHQLAEFRILLSAEFSKASDALTLIQQHKARSWMKIRAHCKSDTSAERTWEATDEGLMEIELKARTKKLEKTMSAVRTMLEVLTAEARNIM